MDVGRLNMLHLKGLKPPLHLSALPYVTYAVPTPTCTTHGCQHAKSLKGPRLGVERESAPSVTSSWQVLAVLAVPDGSHTT